ncbi:helix-turn-helix domain-containing protein [Ferroacidibacillus organovorans]|uniref:Helix-turn-helix domain-containing protein n=1 Tax=Ferroacidibacillus organovorans TaxID=1765683 RepID=A0A1V4ESS3_9BACL|nr:helix-turn-helix domain-containing protein [Ferroacidibacillus organovorans]OPG15996.1 hypothetical protein B2M26_08875 [Ferroacidibacillus organovorans]
MEKQYTTRKAVADAINIPEDTVWRLARQKKIPFIKVGRAYRFNLDEVIEALKGQVK